MNDAKKSTILWGKLLVPPQVGSCAFISYRGELLRTSQVVAIEEISAFRVRFETLNTHYCVLLSPSSAFAAGATRLCA